MDFNLDLNNLKLDIAEKSDEEVCAIGKQVFLEEFFFRRNPWLPGTAHRRKGLFLCG